MYNSSENFREATDEANYFGSDGGSATDKSDLFFGMKPTQSLFSSNVKTNPNVDMSQYAQLTRHARRIYVGGIPPNYADEDIIRNFLNSVIAKGLGEENDNSYVISIYTNQKKCFAFVEVKSIELATACLDLDGIIFKKIVLKILRANEYKPELVTPAMLGKPIRLDLTTFAFGSANIPNYQPPISVHHPSSFNSSNNMNDGLMGMNSSSNSLGINSNHVIMNSNNSSMNSLRVESPRAEVGPLSMNTTQQASHSGQGDMRLDSIIQFIPLNALESGSVVIVGFPYDDSAKRQRSTSPGMAHTTRGQGCAATPKCLRNYIRRFRYGVVDNPEYGVDLAATKFIDVGDVLGGKNAEETRLNLSMTVSELLARGGIPYVVGGSAESSFHSIQGVMAVTGGNIGVLSISASLEHNIHILNDSRFSLPRQGMPPTCEGRYIAFAAQGTHSTSDSARFTVERGGQIVWLSRDLRNSSLKSSAISQFKNALKSLSTNAMTGATRPVVVSLDVGALCSSCAPYSNSSNSPVGLSLDEVLEMVMIAGTNPNVVLFDITEFSPESEESRGNLLLVDIFYRFAMGVTARPLLSNKGSATPIMHGTTPQFRSNNSSNSQNTHNNAPPQLQQQQAAPMPHFTPPSSMYGNSLMARSASASTSNNNSLDSASFEGSMAAAGQHHQHHGFMVSPEHGPHPPRPPLSVNSIQRNSSVSTVSMFSNTGSDSSFLSNSGNSGLSANHSPAPHISHQMQHLQMQQMRRTGSDNFGGGNQQSQSQPTQVQHQQQIQRSPNFVQQQQQQQAPVGPTPPFSPSLAPVHRHQPSSLGVAGIVPFWSQDSAPGAADHNSFSSAGHLSGGGHHTHEFSHRSLHMASASRDFSRSLANMSLADLHEFDETLDLAELSYSAASSSKTNTHLRSNSNSMLADNLASTLLSLAAEEDRAEAPSSSGIGGAQ